MPDYKAMYFNLAAKVADVVEILIAAQQNGEDAYIESINNPIALPDRAYTESQKIETTNRQIPLVKNDEG